jgi:DNA-binding MarR family transcriptional regulator
VSTYPEKTATPSPEPQRTAGLAAAGHAAVPGSAIDAEVEALALEVAAFVGSFERWSSRRAAEAGASSSRMKLLHAVRCHGPRKMADLADELDTTPRNVTAIVDGLEAEGLVRRTPHATDRRVTLVELTCNRDRVAEQFGRYQSSIGELFAEMDADDRRTLLRLVVEMKSRMREAEPGAGERATGRHGDD